MDIIDLFWNVSQDNALQDLKTSHEIATGRDAVLIKRLQEENYELRIRVSLLTRLLIERGVFTVDDFSTLLKETKAKLASAAPRPAGKKTAGAAAPKVSKAAPRLGNSPASRTER